jgi:hypothetical protein
MKPAMKETNVKIGDQVERLTKHELSHLSLFDIAAKGNLGAIKYPLKE